MWSVELSVLHAFRRLFLDRAARVSYASRAKPNEFKSRPIEAMSEEGRLADAEQIANLANHRLGPGQGGVGPVRLEAEAYEKPQGGRTDWLRIRGEPIRYGRSWKGALPTGRSGEHSAPGAMPIQPPEFGFNTTCKAAGLECPRPVKIQNRIRA